MLVPPDHQPISPTIAALKRHAQDGFRPERAAQRAAIYTRVYREAEGQPAVLQAAQALAAFLAEKELVIHPEDLLAGHIQLFDYAYPLTLGAWNPFVREPKHRRPTPTWASLRPSIRPSALTPHPSSTRGPTVRRAARTKQPRSTPSAAASAADSM